MSSPDYLVTDKDHAVEDFKERIRVYEKQYCPLDEELDKNLSFIKIYNQGERYLINNIHGKITALCICECCLLLYVAYILTCKMIHI